MHDVAQAWHGKCILFTLLLNKHTHTACAHMHTHTYDAHSNLKADLSWIRRFKTSALSWSQQPSTIMSYCLTSPSMVQLRWSVEVPVVIVFAPLLPLTSALYCSPRNHFFFFGPFPFHSSSATATSHDLYRRLRGAGVTRIPCVLVLTWEGVMGSCLSDSATGFRFLIFDCKKLLTALCKCRTQYGPRWNNFTSKDCASSPSTCTRLMIWTISCGQRIISDCSPTCVPS